MSSNAPSTTMGPPVDLGVLIGGLDRKGLLIGTWISVLFWAILICQMYLFFQKRTKEHILVKIAILLVFGFETARIGILFNVAWAQLIDAFDNPILTKHPNHGLAYAPLMSGLTILVVNFFLIFRLWRLSKNMWLSVALAVGNLGAYASLTAAHSVFIQVTNGNFRHLYEGKISVQVGLTLAFSIMALITCTLVVHLLRFLNRETSGLRPMILRLVFFTVQSGSATTAMGAATLIYFNRYPTSSNNVIMIGITGAFYACNMLAKLNMRGAGSYGLSLATSSAGGELENAKAVPTSFQLIDPWRYLEEQMLHIKEQNEVREKDDIAPWDNGPAN